MLDVTLGPAPIGRAPRWHRTTAHRTQPRHFSLGILQLVGATAVILIGAAALGWNLSGGRLVVMQTPSMCPTVCVGSLVGDQPLTGPLHVGELITFHPPGNDSETFTHEVSAVFPAGVQTRGVGNASIDPWIITRSQIVGKVAFNVWGVGWLLRALPFFAVGVLMWVLTRLRLPGRYRRTCDRAWITAFVVVPAVLLRPLVRAVVHATVADSSHRGWLRASVVNTGLLPAQFQSTGGPVVAHVASTHLGRVPSPGHHNYALLHETASLYWWSWVIVALVVLSPLLGYLWHTFRGTEMVQSVEAA
jgi:hypothetical protein